MNKFDEMQERTSLLAAIYAAGVTELKDDGFLQAGMIQATFDALKENGCLNPEVEVGVSYMGKVLQSNAKK